MSNQLISKAVNALAPDLDFRVENDDIDTLESLNGKPLPSKSEILAKMDVVKKDAAADLTAKESARAALLQRLGISAEEAALLLG